MEIFLLIIYLIMCRLSVQVSTFLWNLFIYKLILMLIFLNSNFNNKLYRISMILSLNLFKFHIFENISLTVNVFANVLSNIWYLKTKSIYIVFFTHFNKLIEKQESSNFNWK